MNPLSCRRASYIPKSKSNERKPSSKKPKKAYIGEFAAGKWRRGKIRFSTMCG